MPQCVSEMHTNTTDAKFTHIIGKIFLFNSHSVCPHWWWISSDAVVTNADGQSNCGIVRSLQGTLIVARPSILEDVQ
jgi:hypothetical protein